MGPKEISVVVPVFNSEGSLRLLHQRLTAVLAKGCPSYEIIFVDDGSTDSSWKVVTAITKSDRCAHGIQLSRNYGQHNALLAGIRAATKEITITIDDDLQNPPEEIPTLLDEYQKGFDVVYGAPKNERHGFLRDFASQLTKFALSGLMGSKTAQMISAFRVFRTSLRSSFSDYSGPLVSIDVLLTWATQRFSGVRVLHDERRIGKSHYTLKKLLVHAANLMTGFTVLPLQIASFIGFFFTLFGIATFVYIVGLYALHGTPVQGFPFLVSIISIFSGAQLFSLGIIGEYLARVHFRTMDKPPYNISITTDADGSPATTAGALQSFCPGNGEPVSGPMIRL